LTWHAIEQRDKFTRYQSRKDFGNNFHEKEAEMVICGLVVRYIHSLKKKSVVATYVCEQTVSCTDKLA
jgi:hypothetical protein